MIWKLVQVIFRDRIEGIRLLEYVKGVEDGVNQMHHEPRTAMHMVVDQDKYWGPLD